MAPQDVLYCGVVLSMLMYVTGYPFIRLWIPMAICTGCRCFLKFTLKCLPNIGHFLMNNTIFFFLAYSMIFLTTWTFMLVLTLGLVASNIKLSFITGVLSYSLTIWFREEEIYIL